ncbi:MAG: glycosyltransferase family 4 protein [Lautropia sp.]|nr:glycosyltransferase family 4 protein [Lautropia sp.]
MLGHKRVPSREGGVEVVVENLSWRMVQAGCEVTCFNRRGHHVSGCAFDAPVLDEYRGVRLKRLFTINRKGLAALSSSLIGAIRTALGRYDVVHFHAEGPSAMLWLPKLFGKRCIATVHGLDWQRAKWGGFGSRYLKFGEWMAARHADELIVLTEGARRYFKRRYGRDARLIPNGVERPSPAPAKLIRERFGLDKDGYVLFLGRIVPEKGLRYLVEAFRDLKTDKKLVIAGGQSDSCDFVEEIKALVKDDPRVIFTDFVQGETLAELYSNAYIYVLPSDVEGQPLTLLEAMSYGNCCLVSDIEACTSVIDDAEAGTRRGVVFRQGDAQELRARLQWLCDSPEAVAAHRQGVDAFVCRHYDWDVISDRTLRVYERGV